MAFRYGNLKSESNENLVQRKAQDFNKNLLEETNTRDAESIENNSKVLRKTSFTDDLQENISKAIDKCDSVAKIIADGWSHCHFSNLPHWLQDNDYLHFGHRPPLPCFSTCFKSIFKIHTETGNIWTHLLGCAVFIGLTIYFLVCPFMEIDWQEKLVFSTFFGSAIMCLLFSTLFHTVCCHSPNIGQLFCKLDYCGIALLITGSTVLFVYYGFYCHYTPKLIYISGVCILGMAAILVSLMEKFSAPSFRALRTSVFTLFSFTGIIPTIHYMTNEGWFNYKAQRIFIFLILMGLLYIIGAVTYVLRVPERFFPGKFDIWLHSHQIFHVFVISAALVHFQGMTELATHTLNTAQCKLPPTEAIFY